MTTLIVIGSAIAYVLSAAFATGVAARYPETFDGDNGPPPLVVGIFWPAALPIAGLVLGVMKAYRAGKNPVSRALNPVYRLGRYGKLRQRRLPAITVEDGARIESSEQYRQLAAMVQDYERSLPVHEREG